MSSPLPDPSEVDLDRLMNELIGPDRAALLADLVTCYHELCDCSRPYAGDSAAQPEHRSALARLERRFRAAIGKTIAENELLAPELVPVRIRITDGRVLQHEDEFRHALYVELRSEDEGFLVAARGVWSLFENPVALRIMSRGADENGYSCEVLYSQAALHEEYRRIERHGLVLDSQRNSSQLLARAVALVERAVEKRGGWQGERLGSQVSFAGDDGVINIETDAGWYAVTVRRCPLRATVELSCKTVTAPQTVDQVRALAPRALPALHPFNRPSAVSARHSLTEFASAHHLLAMQAAGEVREPVAPEEHQELVALHEVLERTLVGSRSGQSPHLICDLPYIAGSGERRYCCWLAAFLDNDGNSVLLNPAGKNTILKRGPIVYHVSAPADDPLSFECRPLYSVKAFWEETDLVAREQTGLLRSPREGSEILEHVLSIAAEREGRGFTLSPESVRAIKVDRNGVWPCFKLQTDRERHRIIVQLDDLTRSLIVLESAAAFLKRRDG